MLKIFGSYDGTTRLWNLKHGHCEQVWGCEGDSAVLSIASRPKGRFFDGTMDSLLMFSVCLLDHLWIQTTAYSNVGNRSAPVPRHTTHIRSLFLSKTANGGIFLISVKNEHP